MASPPLTELEMDKALEVAAELGEISRAKAHRRLRKFTKAGLLYIADLCGVENVKVRATNATITNWIIDEMY